VIVLPLMTGGLWNEKSWSRTWILGQMTLWALFQVLAVPMIAIHAPFHTLFWSFAAAAAGLSALGIRRRSRSFTRLGIGKPRWDPLMIAAGLIAAFQAGMYLIGVHLDQDDARWLAEANDALSRDAMLVHNPATGAYLGLYKGEMIKDAFSPWSMYIAVMARMTFLKPALIAHTVYAPILVLLGYTVYGEIGKELFEGKKEQGIFLIAIGIINLTFAGTSMTVSAVTGARIWQGKAAVAAVIIPALVAGMLRIHRKNSRKSWLALAVTGCAGCLMSGLGIIASGILIGLYGGYAVLCRRFRRIGYWVLALAAPVIYGLSWLWVRGW